MAAISLILIVQKNFQLKTISDLPHESPMCSFTLPDIYVTLVNQSDIRV